ncbi:MAG: DNA translocase FtsK 4TM domain-containing protein [Oscillospiraceae bacterium]|nr:DNA translocase FtsK 4TM domain-containing protein [Oscillospiraceae bacterium]
MAQRKTTASKSKAAEREGAAEDRVLWSAVLFGLGVLTAAFTLVKGESLWHSIHNIFLGMFGFSVFLVPVIFIYVSIMIAMDKSQQAVQGKVIQCFIVIFLLTAFVQIVSGTEIPEGGLFDEIIPALYAEGKQLRGGGVFSTLLAVPLLALFKKTGATIIILLLIFVSLMVFSNKTVLDLMKILKRWLSKAFAARGEYIPEDDTDFVPPPGAKRQKPVKQTKGKVVPNADVPDEVVKEKAKKFNVDIPMPPGQKLSADSQELPFEPDKPTEPELPAHPVVAPAPAAKPQSKASEEATAKINSANGELDDIIKKAAAPAKKPSIFAPKAAEPKLAEKKQEERKIQKQSTLASNKIQTEEELDMPDAPTAADIQNEITEHKTETAVYAFPPIELLKSVDNTLNSAEAEAEMKTNADTLVDTLKSFGVQTRIVDIHRGPTVTRYELQPSAGVKISKITGLADDIALNLAAAGVRIEAPIPGKAAVGVEVPNKIKDMVTIREMIESPEFAENKSKLSFVVGKNIDGDIMIGDIAKMPHMIIAGTTGSGKSVCTNSIIMSILYNASPDEVRLVLIDPKMVEFKVYDGIPHLLIPVVTDPRKAAGALAWAVQEMLKRYKLFADYNVRDHGGYNEMAAETEGVEPLPKIVIVIDELADLMMAASNEVEDSICRLAQMARAAGMHLIIATQRPTVDVITGLIKANIPSRIALTVSSQIDSRTIIDTAGAEKLLGHGDMLYYPQGIPKPVRIQGCFASTKEVEAVVEFIKSGGTVEYSDEIIQEIEKNMPVPKGEKSASDSSAAPSGDGDIIDQAVELLTSGGAASVSFLQRRLKLGYARAARVMDELEELGVVGPYEGAKPRSVLITKEMWLQRKLINQDNMDSDAGGTDGEDV